VLLLYGLQVSDKITHLGSVEIDGISDSVRQELASILQNSTLPVVIRIGDRKCMFVLLPPEIQTESFSTSSTEKGPRFKRTILSQREREEVGEAIDLRFRLIKQEMPGLSNIQIYAIMAEESETKLGRKYGAREIEGRHSRYRAFMEKRKRKNARF
jgi:hypothetical protein